jgi:hypothetical protein
MIMTARRIDSFSNYFGDLEYIVSTRLKGITWLTRPPYGSSRLRKNLFGMQNLNGQPSGTNLVCLVYLAFCLSG